MGIIVKVYIENNDEEIDIVTLNSEDKKSSSVTITSSVIKDYLNKLGRKEDVSVRRSERITSFKANREINDENAIVNYNNEGEKKSPRVSLIRSVEHDKRYLNDVIQSDVTCSHSGIHETFTAANGSCEKTANRDREVISQNSSNMQLDDVGDCIRVIDSTDESGNCDEQDHLTTDCGTVGVVLSNEVPSSGHILEDTSMCVDSDPSENPGLENANSSTLGTVDAHSQTIVNQSDGTDRDNRVINDGEYRLNNIESSSSRGRSFESETGAENVIASLKNVSYEVDDFLNLVNTTTILHNQNINNARLAVPSLVDEFYSSEMYPEEIEDEDEFEEYFVVEKIAASRFNEETKVLEFLLKAQKCVARKEPWVPMRTNITDLTISHPRSLYIHCPKYFKSYRRLREKFDQYVQFVEMERGYTYNIPLETMSNCPSITDITSNEFSPVVTADVVVDPQKSLNDACLIEPCLDDNKNITPVKFPKNGENINNMTDIGLPSANFYFADMVPVLDDQLVDLVENNPISSTDPINEFEISKNSVHPSSSDRPRKKHRNEKKHLQCPHCSYKTVNASALGNHLRRHTKEFLKCGLCSKRYLSSGALKNHERTHRNGQLSLAGIVGTGVGDSWATTMRNQFLENFKKEVEIPSPFDRNSAVSAEQVRPSIIVNEAATPKCILFGDRNVECKTKSSKKQQKNPRGRSRRMKIEMKKEPDEVIDLCDDVTASEYVQAAPSKSQVLQEFLADTVHAIESNDLFGSQGETSNFANCVHREREEKSCNVSQRPFETAKYPIVLLKRLSVSSYT